MATRPSEALAQDLVLRLEVLDALDEDFHDGADAEEYLLGLSHLHEEHAASAPRALHDALSHVLCGADNELNGLLGRLAP